MSYNEEPISFSIEAQNKLTSLIENLNIKSEQYVRVGVKGGGCAGVSYLLAFDEKDEDDVLYEISPFKVIIKKNHVMHVLGLKVDYIESEESKGFVFENPVPTK